MVGGGIWMPEGYAIGYPNGRSVDENHVIQLDSRGGEGGVAPDIRVPKNYENVMSYASGTDVELEYAVRYLRGN
jgi:carboxyl-terminal processing protease